ncbi:MAG: serine hydrolase [Dehalococcoidia bacterium]
MPLAAFALTSGAATGGAPKITPTATRTPATPRPSPTPTPRPKPPVDGPAKGPGLMMSECVGRGTQSVRAFFLWNPSRGGSQWLDLSTLNDGFAPERFLSAGPLGRDMWGFYWDGLRQGTTHFARVNTLTSTGWKASGTLTFYTPVCDKTAFEPQPAQDMLDLRTQLEAAIKASGIDTAVAITDLRTGETIDVNGASRRLPGCTINLFALMRTAVDLQDGRYPEPVPGDLIGQTINRSDPITSRRLVKDYIGGGDLGIGLLTVGDFMHSLGMNDTLLDHPPAFPQESLYGKSDNQITALDANRGLRALWDGAILRPDWRDYFLRKMTLVKPGLNYLIPAGVARGATVSHKNGFLYAEGWADNDIGIVWFQRGSERYGYAISFYTQFVPTKYGDIALGQRVSSLAWQWFAGRYGNP